MSKPLLDKPILTQLHRLLDSFHGYRTLNSFGFADEKGNLIYSWKESPCYGALYSEPYYDYRAKNIKYFLDWSWDNMGEDVEEDAAVIGMLDKKLLRRYVKYVVQESPVADAFMDKNFSNIMKHGIIIDAAKPLRYALTAAIMIRYAYEYPGRVKMWDTLCKYMPKNGAFFMAHFFRPYNKDMYRFGYYGDGHTLFEDPTKEMLNSWVNGECNLKNEISIAKHPYDYKNLRKIWISDRRKDGTPIACQYPRETLDLGTDWRKVTVDNIVTTAWLRKYAKKFYKESLING